ncbi:MAG: hypothetical protein LBD53_03505, partial [Tannerella sp.]|nr:hypothetical protein [Tannerella sp.]
ERRRQNAEGRRQEAESRKQRAEGTPSLRGTKQSSVPFPYGLLPVFWIASYLAMTNALYDPLSTLKPLAGF